MLLSQELNTTKEMLEKITIEKNSLKETIKHFIHSKNFTNKRQSFKSNIGNNWMFTDQKSVLAKNKIFITKRINVFLIITQNYGENTRNNSLSLYYTENSLKNKSRNGSVVEINTFDGKTFDQHKAATHTLYNCDTSKVNKSKNGKNGNWLFHHKYIENKIAVDC